MRTNKGFFSKALFLENMKRFWPMAFAGFIVYFLSGPMLIMTEGVKSGVRAAMHYINPGYIMAALTLSVAAAVCVFAYLQKVSSTSVMHSMPFSRRSLYVTSYVSGLFLAMLPAIITALLLIVLKKPVYVESADTMYYGGLSIINDTAGDNIYTFGLIGRWFVNQFVLIWFSYTISVFAGIISGNGVIHMLTACGLNCIVPVLYVLYKIYKNTFLFGVTYDEFEPITLMRMHPIFSAMSGSGLGMMKLGEYAWQIVPFYIAVPIIVLALGYVLYRLRPLERATDSYVFRAASLIIGMLLVVVFGSIIGLIFKAALNNSWGFAIGGLVSFVIAEMIVRKTMRIADREGLIHLAVCALALGLIVGGFTMDFFGVENVVPKTEAVESVEIDGTNVLENLKLRDPENIGRIADIHKYIISRKDELKEGYPQEYYGENDIIFQNFKITYNMKNGRKIERLYYVPISMICEGGNLQAVYDSGESMLDVGRIRGMDPSKVSVDLWYGVQEGDGPYCDYSIQDYQLSDAQKAEILSALADDIELRRSDIEDWATKYAYGWHEEGLISGWLNLSNPLGADEALMEELRQYSLSGGAYYHVEKQLNDRGEVISANEYLEYELGTSRSALNDVILRIGSEIRQGETENEGGGDGLTPLPVTEVQLTQTVFLDGGKII